MNTEQERAEFEAWLVVSFPGIRIERLEDQRYVSLEAHFMFEAYQAGRAALQSQEYTSAIGEAGQAYMDSFKYAHPLPVQFRWSELWEVMCAAANEGFPQSQDREDAAQAEWMVDDGRAPWAINSLKDRIKEMRASEKRCRNAFRKDYMRVVSVYFADALGEAAEALEKRLYAIDHARRIEGDGK